METPRKLFPQTKQLYLIAMQTYKELIVGTSWNTHQIFISLTHLSVLTIERTRVTLPLTNTFVWY